MRKLEIIFFTTRWSHPCIKLRISSTKWRHLTCSHSWAFSWKVFILVNQPDKYIIILITMVMYSLKYLVVKPSWCSKFGWIFLKRHLIWKQSPIMVIHHGHFCHCNHQSDWSSWFCPGLNFLLVDEQQLSATRKLITSRKCSSDHHIRFGKKSGVWYLHFHLQHVTIHWSWFLAHCLFSGVLLWWTCRTTRLQR